MTRSDDRRIRREVIGQMMDYAANAIRYRDPGHIRRLRKDYDRTLRSSGGMIHLASIHTMTKRLAPDG